MSSMRVSWLFCVMSACLMSTVSHAAEQTPLAVGQDVPAVNVEVLGISADPVTNLKIFRDAYDLNFTLLSDINSLIAQRFGVPIGKGGSIEKIVDGKEITMTRPFTLKRWTFVADPQGKLIYVNTSVKAAMDGDVVLAAIKKHQGRQ